MQKHKNDKGNLRKECENKQQTAWKHISTEELFILWSS